MKFWDWDIRTWAIILMVGIFSIVFARAEHAYDVAHNTEIILKREIRTNCNRDNYRVSTLTASLLTLARAAEKREEGWRVVYKLSLEGQFQHVTGDLAAVQIGANKIESQALRELTVALANFEGDQSIAPLSPILSIRAQQDCSLGQ